jgi:hypothetical protein
MVYLLFDIQIVMFVKKKYKMKFITISLSLILIIALSLAFIAPRKIKESFIEDEWFYYEYYAIYFRKNNHYSLWKRNGEKLKFLGCGEWNLKKDIFRIKNVPHVKIDISGAYHFQPIPSSSHPFTILSCEEKDIWLIKKDN